MTIVSKSLVNHWWCVINNDVCFLHQDFEKPSPPQKPLPADPLGRSSRLGRGTPAGTHVPGTRPLPIPIPTVPRPAPTMPLPSRWVAVNLLLNFYFLFWRKPTVIDCVAFKYINKTSWTQYGWLTPCPNTLPLIKRAGGQPPAGPLSPCPNMHVHTCLPWPRFERSLCKETCAALFCFLFPLSPPSYLILPAG